MKTRSRGQNSVALSVSVAVVRDPAPKKLDKSGRLVIGQVERHRLNMVSVARVLPISTIWRAANLLIRRHGADAELEAARLQDLMFDRGDDEGRRVWARIWRAIKALNAPTGGLN
jgi:hypothetical protein